MKTIGVSTVLGILLAGVLIYLFDFRNPASMILMITICVGVTASLGSMIGSRTAAKKPTSPAGEPSDAP